MGTASLEPMVVNSMLGLFRVDEGRDDDSVDVVGLLYNERDVTQEQQVRDRAAKHWKVLIFVIISMPISNTCGEKHSEESSRVH